LLKREKIATKLICELNRGKYTLFLNFIISVPRSDGRGLNSIYGAGIASAPSTLAQVPFNPTGDTSGESGLAGDLPLVRKDCHNPTQPWCSGAETKLLIV
jgi:hypothetical protein